jgi:FKBP-type peptidyl-prolyl cis-trans isomerase FkpA
VSLYFFSCTKKSSGCSFQNDNIIAPSSEQNAIKSYLDSSGITNASLNASGFYFQVINPGSKTTPGLCSSVAVNYTGQLTNGKIFDQESNVIFTLGSLIDGWKKGLPIIQSGGEIKLFIPPSLGYGQNPVITATDTIPPNSILIFDVKLISVQ